jgi:hypothetical protein
MPRDPGAAVAPPDSGVQGLDSLETMLDRANAGDAAALAVLRKALELRPGLLGQTGDLAHQCEQAWLQLIAGTQEVFKESLSRHLKTLRRELGGSLGERPQGEPAAGGDGARGVPPLERLLIDRIALNWMATHHAEAVYVQHMDKGVLSPELADYHVRRIGRWQRMYLASIKALAQLHRVTHTLTVAHVRGADGQRLDAARLEASAPGP